MFAWAANGDSRLARALNAGVAQLVEHLSCKQEVRGSRPLSGLAIRQRYASTMGVPGMIGLLAFAAFASRFGLTGAVGGLFAVLLVRLVIGAAIGRQRPD